MSNHLKETANNLNELIETLKDGQKGFAAAAEDVERVDLKALFQDLSSQRERFSAELQAMVVRTGNEPEESGSMAGALHRGWINVKAAVASRDDIAILEECERGEDAAVTAYREALKSDLGDARAKVMEQATAVKSAHDKIRNLRNELRRNKV